MAGITVPEEREQGAVLEQEQAAATNQPPLEQPPAQADEAVVQAAVAQAGGVVPPAQQTVADNTGVSNTGYTVKNPYMLLPTGANFANLPGAQVKTPVERAFDAGLLFEQLALKDPTMKVIADELLRSRRGPIRR